MIQCTVDRVSPLFAIEDIFILTGERYKDLVKEQLPTLPESNILLEPCAKNTAPALALATKKIKEIYGDAIVTVLASDHYIKDEKEFLRCLEVAQNKAIEGNNLVTLGIVPIRADVGYGYIKLGGGFPPVFAVQKFVEKPDLETAEKYLASGQYLWNSGMFIWKNSVIEEAFKKHAPIIKKYIDGKIEFEDESLEKISIDYAVMENAKNVYVVKGDFGWDDVGSHEAIERVKSL